MTSAFSYLNHCATEMWFGALYGFTAGMVATTMLFVLTERFWSKK